MPKAVPFLKGHMGGNEIVLVPRRKFPAGSELESGLEVLERPGIRGDQLGLLFGCPGGSHLGAKIVDIHSRDYLSMCGGMTQVLGRACKKLDLAELLELDHRLLTEEIHLETEMGVFPIRSDNAVRTVTGMDSFIDSIYETGIETGSLDGVMSFRIGDFLVTFEEEIRKNYSGISFSPLDQPTKDVLIELQNEFRNEFATENENRDFAVMGDPEDEAHDGRLIFPHNLSEGLLEPACGTGTVAVAVALVEEGMISGRGEIELDFETGGRREYIGGPEITKVTLEVGMERVRKARFSHELVEVLAAGRLFL